MEPIEVEPTDVVEKEVDQYGRISVGREYAGKTLRVAVLEDVTPTKGDFAKVVAQLADEGDTETAKDVAETVGLEIDADALEDGGDN